MRTLGLVMLAGLMAREAAAAPCGGGDSGSDDSWSSFSSDDDDDGTPVGPSPQIDWAAMPAISVELGTSMFQVTSPLASRTGTVTHGVDSFSYRVVAPRQPESDTAIVGTLRLGVALAKGLYVGAEGNIGGLAGGRVAAEMMSATERGAPNIEATGVGVAGLLGVVGARTRLGRLDLGVEAAGGVRSLIYQYESHYLACETTSSIIESMPALEARGRASVWVTPHIQVGASAGKSLLDESWITGIHVGATSRVFGGP
ncbi:MAG: hypothetical protein JNL83_19605 [Myxococcales bacterium]|nr:hypothetical protein [Myxococcales bacterium]